MKRNIIKIDEDKCDGCGLCINACHEGAIQLVNGKAKLISDKYCDGLGNCLPACPTGAIEILEREADEYSEEAVEQLKGEKESKPDGKVKPMACGCPGTMARQIEKPKTDTTRNSQMPKEISTDLPRQSELRQWPVQLKLINTQADYLKDADLLLAADCTAFAYADFHKDFIKDHVTLVGCPKLDDVQYYREKLGEILKNNNIKSLTVVRMEVPCCGGIVSIAKQAMLDSQIIVPYKEVIIGVDGEIKK